MPLYNSLGDQPPQPDGTLAKGHVWRGFMINISLIIILFLAGIFLGFVMRTNRILKDQIITTARAHFNNIVLTRRWNANYGGVFVKKTAGVVSNPYLKNPDIQTAEGVVYTKKNPALMTREISVYAEAAGDFNYHITSLKPLNPGNAADAFETAALRQFETGLRESSATFNKEGRSVFRYMAPLFVEKGCLACHADQGYVVGDVRGGISVSFDITKIIRDMAFNKIMVGALSVATVSALLAIIIFLVSRLAKRLSTAYQIIERMSVTDELTKLFNRRYFHSRLDIEIHRARRYQHPLSLFMLDIDHFKKINDLHGHMVGDEVLAGVAGILSSTSRNSDVVARYGGEEMVVILPETDSGGAVSSANKIRQRIQDYRFSIGNAESTRVTASFGVATFTAETVLEGDIAKELVKSADEALYRAKAQGRNRVVAAPTG